MSKDSKASRPEIKNPARKLHRSIMDASGGIIEKARKKAGLTQKRLAQMLKVTAGSISSFEKGNSLATLGKASELVKVLKIKGKDAAYLQSAVKTAGGFTKKAAGNVSRKVSGGAARTWSVLSAEDKKEMTRSILALAGNLPGTRRKPSDDDKVIFAARAAQEDERLFKKMLDAFEIPVGKASQIIARKLQAQLRSKADS
ncbi:MAG: helix-turn-helix transcriptional regulator [SAR324 cluster bacterium]|nr:helix-turn-helix transcriptional regulator [SAR324 cluster bacterium]MCZ6627556.1 helix-turn-helix transcriptional regulator [SAR324 cluster bacterium]MCZ6843543.1 helix-turn-helix transcriptional regulator [SAR324 cluster bacterium]